VQELKVLPYKPKKKWKGCLHSEVRKVPGYQKEIVYCEIDKHICAKELCSSPFQYRDCETYKRNPIEEIPLATDEGYIPVTV